MPQNSPTHPRLILASGSPRRSELIALTGWQVAVDPVSIDESELPGEEGRRLALRLAETKARTAAGKSGAVGIILAADTVVSAGDEILGKPDTNAEALQMLMALRDQIHQVHTAIALYDPIADRLVSDICTTDVSMRDFSRNEAESYVQSGSPLDKAGAYGIQDQEFQPVVVTQMTGCYANVVGLPLCHLVRTIRALGYEPDSDVPSRCQEHTGYDCGVYPEILKDKM